MVGLQQIILRQRICTWITHVCSLNCITQVSHGNQQFHEYHTPCVSSVDVDCNTKVVIGVNVAACLLAVIGLVEMWLPQLVA